MPCRGRGDEVGQRASHDLHREALVAIGHWRVADKMAKRPLDLSNR